MIKYYYRVNQYGNRDKLINPNKTEECPWCSQEEIWQHLIQCTGNLLEAKVNFIIDLYIKLMKVKLNIISDGIIRDMIADIRENL